jgi:hypothetical protein
MYVPTPNSQHKEDTSNVTWHNIKWNYIYSSANDFKNKET